MTNAEASANNIKCYFWETEQKQLLNMQNVIVVYITLVF